jgi:fumarate reductase subunit D
MKKILGWALVLLPIWLGPYIHNQIMQDFKLGVSVTCYILVFFGIRILLSDIFKYLIKIRDFLDK